MTIRQFEDLIAWQKAQDMAVNIYQVFSQLRDFNFKNQICDAAVSVSSNIAEGFDRSSDKDFVRFLYIGISSCSEVRSMVYLAFRLGYINGDNQETLINATREVSKIIRGLIRSIDNG